MNTVICNHCAQFINICWIFFISWYAIYIHWKCVKLKKTKAEILLIEYKFQTVSLSESTKINTKHSLFTQGWNAALINWKDWMKKLMFAIINNHLNTTQNSYLLLLLSVDVLSQFYWRRVKLDDRRPTRSEHDAQEQWPFQRTFCRSQSTGVGMRPV